MRMRTKTVIEQMNAEKPDDVLVDLEAKHGLSQAPCPPISFHLTQEQTNKFSAWAKGRIGQGAIGGRITVSFTGTSIGTIVKAKDHQTGAEIDLSDYEDW